MRVVVQRVKRASVTVEDRVVGSIGPGLLCLVGVCDGDTAKDEEWARNRVVGIRLWTDPETGKRWQKSVKDLGYEVLLVSQFTLHGYAKGNKPDFHYAMGGDDALAAFDSFVAAVKSKYRPDRVATGAFGEYMQVESVNDGPVTMVFDSDYKVHEKKEHSGATPVTPASPSPATSGAARS